MKAKNLKKLLDKVSEDTNITFKVSPETEGFEDFDFEEDIYVDIRKFNIELNEDDGYEEFVSLS